MAVLPTDDNGVPTSAQKINPAAPVPGATEWSQYNVIANGGDIAEGKTTDVAVLSTDATAGTVIGLLKGIIYRLTAISTGQGPAASAFYYREDDAHASLDRGIQMLAVRQDTPGTGLGANGDYASLIVDLLGRLRVVTKDEASDSSNSTSAALEASRVAKASAGKLWGFQGHVSTTLGAGTFYIQVFDAATATGAPKFSIPILAGQSFSFDGTRKGRAHATGIVIGLSSTETTFTSGGSFMWVDVQYE